MVGYNISSLLQHAPSNDGDLNSNNAWHNKTVSIRADNDIAVVVIGSVTDAATAASYLVYPTEAFSTQFVMASYTSDSGNS